MDCAVCAARVCGVVGGCWCAVSHQDTVDIVAGLLYRGLRNRLSVISAALIAGVSFALIHAGGYPLVTLPAKARRSPAPTARAAPVLRRGRT